jgi:hypothetical protein
LSQTAIFSQVTGTGNTILLNLPLNTGESCQTQSVQRRVCLQLCEIKLPTEETFRVRRYLAGRRLVGDFCRNIYNAGRNQLFLFQMQPKVVKGYKFVIVHITNTTNVLILLIFFAENM